MGSEEGRALAERFERELAAAGWAQTSRTSSSTRFERGRCQVAVGVQDGGSVSWTVFPTLPRAEDYPGVVFTRPSPVPLAAFVIDPASGSAHVWRHSYDRSGRMTRQSFLSGDPANVLARLQDESSRCVDDYVRLVEKPPER